MSRPLIVNDKVVIPANELSTSFVRSAGPGGQNVNKVNSKSVLRWNVSQSYSLPQAAKSRFLERYANRLSKNGEIILTSDRHREQFRNTTDCYEKLRKLILAILQPPKVRRPTRASRGSVERRLEKKKLNSKRKGDRSRRWDRES